MKSCIWSQNELGGNIYYSGCGSEFVMNDDCLPPIESGLHYCCFCGKELTQELWGAKADNLPTEQIEAWEETCNRLKKAMIRINGIATGELQVAHSDTEGMAWIAAICKEFAE